MRKGRFFVVTLHTPHGLRRNHWHMQILIVSDSFKGSLSSLQAGQAMALGVRDAWPECHTTVRALSDGGEGMAQAFAAVTQAQWHTATVADPLGRPVQARYALTHDGTAYIETAAASGLTLLRPDERQPLLTHTLGTGQLVVHALRQGARRLVVGLGGSATNDAGMGMMQALGVRFLDDQGRELPPCGQNLIWVQRVDDAGLMGAWREARIVAACDVRAPLYGPQGAAHVFAAQKGASPEQTALLDKGLRHMGQLLLSQYGRDYAQQEGAGAAGGLGAALACFGGARMASGVELLLRTPLMERALREADLVITGEGRWDGQSSMGKAPWGILQACRRFAKPCLAVFGSMGMDGIAPTRHFAAHAVATPPGQSLAEAMMPRQAAQNVRQATARLLSHWGKTT